MGFSREKIFFYIFIFVNLMMSVHAHSSCKKIKIQKHAQMN